MKFIIHAGFHKTGTTSAQMALRQNAFVDQAVRLVLRDDILPLTKSAQRYSRTGREAHLHEFDKQARAVMAEFVGEPRPVLITAEDLAGWMPGRAGVRSYDACPPLMQTFYRAARAQLGDKLDLTFYFSTRDTEGWIKSTYWQHLRSTRIETSFDEYRESMGEAADLEGVVRQVRSALPHTRVISQPLEALRNAPHGPATAFYDLLELPEAQRGARPDIENARIDLGLEPVFLALNRSGLPDDCVHQTKQRLLRVARRASD
ncbi:hypothetical protein [Primorskyibacter sp. 2E233]|uniref:hypothetical protein n=1 Tax=Primorskyibacter sp. 2E233 TaxID=3413431 RepID=UPI003BF22F99